MGEVFDKAAIEEAAVAISLYETSNTLRSDDCRLLARVALKAAVESLWTRSRLHYREGLSRLADGSFVTRQGHLILGTTPVAIIKLEESPPHESP